MGRSSLVVIALAACGGAHKQVADDSASFNCKDRAAAYTATMPRGNQVGVEMDCAEAGPRVKRWRVDKDGNRQDDTHAISAAAFEKVWAEVDGTGWQNLHDCPNGSLAKSDPVYQFAIKNDEAQAAFKCQTLQMPYPYNDITDPLDLAANQGQKQLGDDEPSDAKALDQKDKQR